MAARKITCTNEDGIEIVLTDAFSPYLLEACDGIYEFKANVSMSANTMTDGSTYQGSVTSMRNIVLSLRDKPGADHMQNRAFLYNVFKPKSQGVFTYEENDVQRTINYYVESVIADGQMRSRRATVSLLCPDPFFQDISDITVQMAGWTALWEWQHEFVDGGEEFGSRIQERIKEIDNESAADGIGLTIEIDASGPITNPSISHVEQGETITIGTAGNPLELENGDRVIITTGTNNKHVYLVSGGVKTEINEYLSEDSEFLQLMHGINTFGYAADAGDEHMTVTISFRYKYLGV
ncbi:MAG: phage tail family protein [Clostridia bacterium]|nr:phage tail family protein [Clostridia bacterium]